jgi:K+-transporting ATPase KdpF subunit
LPGAAKEILMDLTYLLSGLIAVAIFVYLLAALFKPEMFE